MKSAFARSIALLTALAALPVFCASAWEAPPPGGLQLWNERDLDGWGLFLKDTAADPKTAWSADKGVLRFAGKPVCCLRTRKTFSNYRLHVEWRWPANADAKSNSGVFVHINGPDVVWPKCLQCQVKGNSTGDLIGMTGFDFDAPVVNGNKQANKIAAPSEKPSGEWNVYEIFCRADTIEVFVNGVRQNHLEKLPVTSGSIGLQIEGYPVEFRAIWLQPL
jgi:hypothetical protein